MEQVPPIAAHEDPLHATAHRESMPLYRLSQFIVYSHLRLWHRLKVEGLEHIPPTGGLIVVANHVSHLDPPLLGCAMARPIHYLAKADLFNKPFLSWWLRQLGQVPVAREGSGGGGLALKTGIRLLLDGLVLGIFPEGGRSRTNERQKARTGVVVLASMGNAAILPTYLSGTYAAFPPRSKLPIPGKPIGIRYGEPFRLTPEQQNLHDRERMERTAEEIMDRVFALAPTSANGNGAVPPDHG